jgi:FtsZ-binding cell division protein ZapB
MEYVNGNKGNHPGVTSRDRKNNIIVIVLIVILAVLTFLFFSQRKNNQIVVSQITARKDSIQVELSRIITGYDSLKVENDTLTNQMTVSKNRVQELLTEVEQTKKISLEKIGRYQQEVNTLRDIMRNYVVQIDSLNQRNKTLMEENLQVKEQARATESRNQQLSQEKDQLEMDLKKAATLEALDISATALNTRNKDTRFASRAAMIRVNFTLAKNVTAKKGDKNIYIRIMRPDQLLLNKSENDVFKFENIKIPFSAVREITYEGAELPVAIFWDNQGQSPLITGDYTIDVFADGSNIGTGKLTLK